MSAQGRGIFIDSGSRPYVASPQGHLGDWQNKSAQVSSQENSVFGVAKITAAIRNGINDRWSVVKR